MSPDLDQLADDHLDDLLSEAVWREAIAAHGDALDAAVARARARRAAIAGLPRSDLDETLRDRLILAAPRPRQRAAAPAQRWWLLAGSGLAAAILVVVFRSTEPTSAPEDAPVLATRTTAASEAGAAPAPSIADDPQMMRRSAPASAEIEGLAKASPQRLDDLAEQRLTETTRTRAPAGFASMAQPVEAPGPHELVLAWAPPARQEGGTIRAAATRELQAEADNASPAPPAAPSQALMAAPVQTADAAAPAELSDAHVTEAEAGATGGQRLSLALHNRTVTPWTVAAEDIRIEALDAEGAVVWRGRVLAEGEVVVAAGATATLFIDDPAWPTQTQSLRATIVEVRSRPLPIDAQ